MNIYTPNNHLTEVRFLLCDVDDTITTEGRLLPETLQAMYQLQAAGIKIIPVTGGCAGWCDHIVRLWPVEGIIGENGAFHLQRDDLGHVTLIGWHDENERSRNQQRLMEVAQQAIALVPDLQLAKDQSYRLADVAIDYNQDCSGASQAQLQQVVDLFEAQGANAKISSIHINTWFGEYNKLAMGKRVLEQQYQLSEDEMLSQVAYIGDAPNDELMFSFFRHTFGVANIAAHLPGMRYHPNTVLNQPGGLGFAELSELLLSAKQA